jgi:uncharacterized protein related to proFAR isomerase
MSFMLHVVVLLQYIALQDMMFLRVQSVGAKKLMGLTLSSRL